MEYSENGIKIKRIIQENFQVNNPERLVRIVKEIEMVLNEIITPLKENAELWENEAREAMDARDANEYGRKESEDALKAIENSKYLDALWKMFYSY